jgi:uncharacterized protein YndB with AHSA1/START domain
MHTKLTVKRSIQIHGDVKKVWKALTDPTYMPHYMYGCTAITEWHPGSTIVWMNLKEGKAYVKGHIVQHIPHMILQYTTFDLNNPAYKDIPRNYAVFSWELEENNGVTTLTVTQTGFEYMQDGKERFKQASESEDDVLHKIKAIVENI